MDPKEAKLRLLQEINAAKDVLFGKTFKHSALQKKIDMWKEICNMGKILGVLDDNRDFRYMRDVCWQNWKRRALAKREIAKKLGRRIRANAVDELVFKILDFMESNNRPVNSEFTNNDRETLESSETIEEVSMNQDEDNTEKPEPLLIPKPKIRKVFDTKPNMVKIHLGNYKVPDKKEQLELEFLELQNYKTKLEVLELEFKLGLSHSKYTKEIAKKVSGGNASEESD